MKDQPFRCIALDSFSEIHFPGKQQQLICDPSYNVPAISILSAWQRGRVHAEKKAISSKLKIKVYEVKFYEDEVYKVDIIAGNSFYW